MKNHHKLIEQGEGDDSPIEVDVTVDHSVLPGSVMVATSVTVSVIVPVSTTVAVSLKIEEFSKQLP